MVGYTFLSAFVSYGIEIFRKCVNSLDNFCMWRNHICFKKACLNPIDKMNVLPLLWLYSRWPGKELFFRQLTGLSIRNLSLQVRPSKQRYIVMYWGGEGGHEAEAARQNARVQWGAPSVQCTSTHRFSCAVVFDLQKHDCHPPQSPDLAPCDFFLFPKMKLKLKGWRFDTVKDIQAKLQ